MSITSLRPLSRLQAHPILTRFVRDRIKTRSGELFAIALLREGHVAAQHLIDAVAARARHDRRLTDGLLAMGAISEQTLYAAMAKYWRVGLVDFTDFPPELDLIIQCDPLICLQQAWVPWRRLGHTTVIVCAYPEDFVSLRERLQAIFGHVVLAIAPRSKIESALMAQVGARLARRAETRVSNSDSCRSYDPKPLFKVILGVALGVLLLAYLQPTVVVLTLVFAALILAYLQIGLKLLAVVQRVPPPAPVNLLPNGDLPMISIMVALYKESRIVARLIRRLEYLDYPPGKLEVIFLIEDADRATATALSGLQLPLWMRVVSVPTGRIRTKPRALNYGLDHCRGSIIGVYDAEDAPAADQLRVVANHFLGADDRLACLQGRLDYYNPNSNWLARCFTIEYAAWWRIFLPGIERLGLALPLGGTTLFFRRAALADLGAWDAHNVTEDADLGIRLARRGYRCELIPTVTQEEANCRTSPWIKQRSRWIKGFMMTWATHMRDPALLYRELGLRRFIGFQVMFAGSFFQALFAPILWTLWLLPFGLFGLGPLPASAILPLASFGILAEAFLFCCNLAALRKTDHKINPLWIFTMLFYNMLASFAAYKALWEMLFHPFYWDKTSHGLYDSQRPTSLPARPLQGRLCALILKGRKST
jgi:cellulose synthase/poly-beta-1,6-N-acetylglucosamine synthase-like glycosyltransferase